jgi:hypothetical protein
MADPETDAAIAAKWPVEWAKANNPALRRRSKARQKLRQRFAYGKQIEALLSRNPTAACANCDNFERVPNSDKMHCSAESDFYGYQIASPRGLCLKWRASGVAGGFRAMIGEG